MKYLKLLFWLPFIIFFGFAAGILIAIYGCFYMLRENKNILDNGKIYVDPSGKRKFTLIK